MVAALSGGAARLATAVTQPVMPPTTVARRPIMAPSPMLPLMMLPMVIVSPRSVRLAMPTTAIANVLLIGSRNKFGELDMKI